jgi:hypothetical protein
MFKKCTVQEAKSPVKISSMHISDIKFLALPGAPYIYIYDISRLIMSGYRRKTL